MYIVYILYTSYDESKIYILCSVIHATEKLKEKLKMLNKGRMFEDTEMSYNVRVIYGTFKE